MAAMDFGSLWFSKTSKISKISRVTLGAQACCCKMLQSHNDPPMSLRTRLSALSELSKTCRGAVMDRIGIALEWPKTSKTTRNSDDLGSFLLQPRWGMPRSHSLQLSVSTWRGEWLEGWSNPPEPSDCNCVTRKAWKYVACGLDIGRCDATHLGQIADSLTGSVKIWQDLTSETSHFQGRTKPWMVLICTNMYLVVLANTWQRQICRSSWLKHVKTWHRPHFLTIFNPSTHQPDRPDLLHGRFHPRKWDELVSVIHIQGQVTSAPRILDPRWSKTFQDPGKQLMTTELFESKIVELLLWLSVRKKKTVSKIGLISEADTCHFGFNFGILPESSVESWK